MTQKFKWGVIGPGRISQRFAAGVKSIKDAEVYAVASTSQARADSFAKKYSIPKSYDSYEALVSDPTVDAIYIGSLHHLHFPSAMLCLEAGKPVLCEKPLTVNAAETKRLIATARDKKVFLMEALWTRYLPIYGQVRQWLDAGRIGEVKLMNSTFGFKMERDADERWLNPDLAGGNLLDMGIYPLSISQWVMGQTPKSFSVQSMIGDTGVDEFTAGMLVYENGAVSQFSSNFLSTNINDFMIYGTEGYIRLHPYFWDCTQATLMDFNAGEEITKTTPFKGTGFEYEIEEAMRCIGEGLLESPTMSHADTLATMELMDSIRTEMGLKYPFE